MKLERTFSIRAIEIHGHIWDERIVLRALDFAERNDMNALVLHANDIVDEIVWPAAYYDSGLKEANLYEHYNKIHQTLYEKSARRRYMPIHRRDFIRWTINKAKQKGIKVYLENKELWFPDILEDSHTKLRRDGYLCCSSPVWWEFLETKYRELTGDLPDLAGVITSPGSKESRLTISGNNCHCDRCKKITNVDWYFQLIMSIYKPLSQSGMNLIVRDFVFDKATQTSLVSAMDRLPENVILSLKNTPHDFYPTFPHNPKIGQTGNRTVWIEFDAMGQYFGWGVGIADLVLDIKERITFGVNNGAEGIVIRTDWEGLPNHTCFDTPNLINLYAASAFATDIKTKNEDIYRKWLEEENMITDQTNVELCTKWIQNFLSQTWGVIRRALFMNDCVFSDSSCFPVGLDHAFWLAEEKNSLQDWVPEKRNALEPMEENIHAIIREKDEALRLCQMIMENLWRENKGLNEQAYEKIKYQFHLFEVYVEGFSLIGKSAILARYGTENQWTHEIRENLLELLDQLLHYAKKLERLAEEENWSFVNTSAMNPERIKVFYQDVLSKIDIKEKVE